MQAEDEDGLLPSDPQPNGGSQAEYEDYQQEAVEREGNGYPKTAASPLTGRNTAQEIAPDHSSAQPGDQLSEDVRNPFAEDTAGEETLAGDHTAAAPTTPIQGAHEAEPVAQISDAGVNLGGEVAYEDESPERSPMGSPIRSPIRSPVRSPAASPARSRGGSPQGRRREEVISEERPQLRSVPEQRQQPELQPESAERQRSGENYTWQMLGCIYRHWILRHLCRRRTICFSIPSISSPCL